MGERAPPADDIPAPPYFMLPAPDCPSALPYTCTTTPYNLNFVVGWLGDLLKASRPPTRARWATAPMQQGNVVLTFWSAESPPLHPPKAPEAVYGYRRAGPTGWWTLWCGQDGPAEHTLPDVDVSAPTCGHCGRPQPATAELHLCPSPAHPIYSPRAFCPHPQAAPSVTTKEVAARCFTRGPHGVEPHSVNVSALPWHARCTPACRTPVLPQSSFLSALPSPVPTPDDLAAPLTLYCNNLTGADHQTGHLLQRLHSLKPDLVMFQEVWSFDSMETYVPSRLRTATGTAVGAGTGFVTAWGFDLQQPQTEHQIVHDDRNMFGVTSDVQRDAHSFLLPESLDQLASAVSPSTAAPWPDASPGGYTVWLGAVDRHGTAVSLIQSIYWEFGSGLVLPETGLTWQNRGASFSLDPAHRNALQPGRRPFHTIQPAMAQVGIAAAYIVGRPMGQDYGGLVSYFSIISVFALLVVVGAFLQATKRGRDRGRRCNDDVQSYSATSGRTPV